MTHQSSPEEVRVGEPPAAAGITLLLTAQVRAEKRAEFLLSARSLGPHASVAFFEGLDDPGRLCAVWHMEADVGDPPYLQHTRFRALKGALRTLASEWDLRVLHEGARWCTEHGRDT